MRYRRVLYRVSSGSTRAIELRPERRAQQQQRAARSLDTGVSEQNRAFYGRFSKLIHVFVWSSDPGASNSCMHTFPEKHVGCYCGLARDYLCSDVGFEILDLRFSELKL